jgi:hypothetical protein
MRLASISFILLATTAACGGGSDDRILSELSDTEHVELCEDFSAGLSDADIAGLVGFSCLIGEGFAQDGCMQTRLDTCIEDGIAAWTGLDCEVPDADDAIRTCDATVDELTSCIDAQYAQYNDLGDATCADLETSGPGVPAACGPLMEKCPDFFGSDEQ